MKKILISLLACLLICIRPMPKITVSIIRTYQFRCSNQPCLASQTIMSVSWNVAVMVTGLTMNTQAFAKAISKLNKMGGGHLNVPAGIYLTGLISLKDNIDLHLEKNAIIVLL